MEEIKEGLDGVLEFVTELAKLDKDAHAFIDQMVELDVAGKVTGLLRASATALKPLGKLALEVMAWSSNRQFDLQVARYKQLKLTAPMPSDEVIVALLVDANTQQQLLVARLSSMWHEFMCKRAEAKSAAERSMATRSIEAAEGLMARIKVMTTAASQTRGH